MKFITPSPFPVKIAKNRKLMQAEYLHRLQCGKHICFTHFYKISWNPDLRYPWRQQFKQLLFVKAKKLKKGLLQQIYNDLTYIFVLEK